MAKNFDATFDAGLNAMKAGAIRVAVCSSQPANYGAIAAATLGTVTISSTDFTGPADHTTGRKLTFNGKDVTISTGGTVTHLVFHDNSAVLWGVTTTTSQVVVGAEVWTIPSCIVPACSDPA